jgi:hypothetical protein
VRSLRCGVLDGGLREPGLGRLGNCSINTALEHGRRGVGDEDGGARKPILLVRY